MTEWYFQQVWCRDPNIEESFSCSFFMTQWQFIEFQALGKIFFASSKFPMLEHALSVFFSGREGLASNMLKLWRLLHHLLCLEQFSHPQTCLASPSIEILSYTVSRVNPTFSVRKRPQGLAALSSRHPGWALLVRSGTSAAKLLGALPERLVSWLSLLLV